MTVIDPWAVLGIAPTDDTRAVRRAYAARLRVTSPETDPEAFAELRQAYEYILNGLHDERSTDEFRSPDAHTSLSASNAAPEAQPVEPRKLDVDHASTDAIADALLAMARPMQHLEAALAAKTASALAALSFAERDVLEQTLAGRIAIEGPWSSSAIYALAQAMGWTDVVRMRDAGGALLLPQFQLELARAASQNEPVPATRSKFPSTLRRIAFWMLVLLAVGPLRPWIQRIIADTWIESVLGSRHFWVLGAATWLLWIVARAIPRWIDELAPRRTLLVLVSAGYTYIVYWDLSR